MAQPTAETLPGDLPEPPEDLPESLSEFTQINQNLPKSTKLLRLVAGRKRAQVRLAHMRREPEPAAGAGGDGDAGPGVAIPRVVPQLVRFCRPRPPLSPNPTEPKSLCTEPPGARCTVSPTPLPGPSKRLENCLIDTLSGTPLGGGRRPPPRGVSQQAGSFPTKFRAISGCRSRRFSKKSTSPKTAP